MARDGFRLAGVVGASAQAVPAALVCTAKRFCGHAGGDEHVLQIQGLIISMETCSKQL